MKENKCIQPVELAGRDWSTFADSDFAVSGLSVLEAAVTHCHPHVPQEFIVPADTLQ